MLLEGHYLDGVIAEVSYFRKDIKPEFFECSHSFLFGSHSDVAFVDEGMRSLARLRVAPLIRLYRIPYLCAELLGLYVLDGSCDVGRESFRSSTRPFDEEFV